MTNRVEVWSGDQKDFLGEGTLVGGVSVFFFAMPDGSLWSLSNCEERPPQKLIEETESQGAELIEQPWNPKIVLDSGDVVYGCQVWWQCKDAAHPTPADPDPPAAVASTDASNKSAGGLS